MQNCKNAIERGEWTLEICRFQYLQKFLKNRWWKTYWVIFYPISYGNCISWGYSFIEHLHWCLVFDEFPEYAKSHVCIFSQITQHLSYAFSHIVSMGFLLTCLLDNRSSSRTSNALLLFRHTMQELTCLFSCNTLPIAAPFSDRHKMLCRRASTSSFSLLCLVSVPHAFVQYKCSAKSFSENTPLICN